MLLREARRLDVDAVVAAPRGSPLAALAAEHRMRLLHPDEPPGDAWEMSRRTLLLIDDSDAFIDTAAGEALATMTRRAPQLLAVVAATRTADSTSAYRGVGAEVRRAHCALVLQPSPSDAELVGVRLPRRSARDGPGRGVLVGCASLPSGLDSGLVEVQVAMP